MCEKQSPSHRSCRTHRDGAVTHRKSIVLRALHWIAQSSANLTKDHWASPTFAPLKVQELFQQVTPNTGTPKTPKNAGGFIRWICEWFTSSDVKDGLRGSLFWRSLLMNPSANVIHPPRNVGSHIQLRKDWELWVSLTLGAPAFATNWHRSACLPAKACCHGHQPKHVPNYKWASILANSCQTPNDGIWNVATNLVSSIHLSRHMQSCGLSIWMPNDCTSRTPQEGHRINLRTLRLLHRSRKRKACLDFRGKL